MSLITRCPACGTQFKVVSDQLKVSEGWVRCGQCSQVFDAQLHLQAKVSLKVQEAQPIVVETEPAIEFKSAEVSNQVAEPDTLLASESSIATATDSDLSGRSPADADKFETHTALDDVSFVRDARRRALWQKPLVRVALAVCGSILVCILALQIALQHQEAVSTFEPKLKPWLERICNVAGCANGTPKRIDAVVIDSSSFNKTNAPGAYQLSFSLKNTGNVAVAMPAIEITLTDTQDQNVIRRVVSATQFGAANRNLPGNSEFSNTLTLQVQADFPVSKIAGYRLFAFYP